jgi:hypothetical protein
MKHNPPTNILYNTVSIQYGLTDLKNLPQLSNLYLIEPRKKFIDQIYNNTVSTHTHLIKKILTNSITETFIYTNSNSLMHNSHYSLSQCTSYKERVYTTTLNDIIKSNNIQRINKFVWNLDIDNYTDMISNLISYNNIISEIWINKNIRFDTLHLENLSQYYDTITSNTNNYIEKDLIYAYT